LSEFAITQRFMAFLLPAARPDRMARYYEAIKGDQHIDYI
jgi:hypothetical protein